MSMVFSSIARAEWRQLGITISNLLGLVNIKLKEYKSAASIHNNQVDFVQVPSAFSHMTCFCVNDKVACAGLVEGKRRNWIEAESISFNTKRLKQASALPPLKNTCDIFLWVWKKD